MSDATVVSGQAGTGDHGTGDHGTGDEGRPSFLPPPTFPAAMLLDDDTAGAGDGAEERAPVAHRAPPEEAPARPNLVIRLGHRLCGFR